VKKQIPAVAVAAIAVLIVAVFGYMALVKPKQSEAQGLENEIAQLEAENNIERQRQDQFVLEDAPGAENVVRVADLVRLAKAMPEDPDVAGILVEFDAIATGAGVEFLSIQPLEPVDSGGYVRQPIQLTFAGSYFDLNELLFELRNLVRVREGRLQATGRLFTIDQFDIHESSSGFPAVEALLTVSAYRFGSLEEADLLGLPAEALAETPTETFESETTETTETTETGEVPQLPESSDESGAS
jgi:Tfp pilus assembly protein PilO